MELEEFTAGSERIESDVRLDSVIGLADNSEELQQIRSLRSIRNAEVSSAVRKLFADTNVAKLVYEFRSTQDKLRRQYLLYILGMLIKDDEKVRQALERNLKREKVSRIHELISEAGSNMTIA